MITPLETFLAVFVMLAILALSTYFVFRSVFWELKNDLDEKESLYSQDKEDRSE